MADKWGSGSATFADTLRSQPGIASNLRTALVILYKGHPSGYGLASRYTQPLLQCVSTKPLGVLLLS